MEAKFIKKNYKIIESATKVFSKKGFADATISEIAKGAKIASSGIYLYYENKEALLFKIIENFLIKSCEGLSEHLQGIQGSENKLRKAIWFHCKSYSGNKNEIQIILEARSYPRFYKSTAYTALKKYSRIFTDIIKQGMQDNTFNNITSPGLLRDIILGTVDHIAINWTLKKAPTPLVQWEKIFDIIMFAVRSVCTKEIILDKKAEKRATIINSAIILFAERGFNGTSMFEIAKKSKVAEGTVYDYFSSKEDLLISIPCEKLNSLYDTMSGNSPEMRIKQIISNIFEFYSNEKAYSTILVLMLRTNKKFHKSQSNKMIENLFKMIKVEINKGQDKNEFKQGIDMKICQDLLFGTLDHIMIPRIIFNREYDLRSLGNEMSDLFINMIKV